MGLHRIWTRSVYSTKVLCFAYLSCCNNCSNCICCHQRYHISCCFPLFSDTTNSIKNHLALLSKILCYKLACLGRKKLRSLLQCRHHSLVSAQEILNSVMTGKFWHPSAVLSSNSTVQLLFCYVHCRKTMYTVLFINLFRHLTLLQRESPGKRKQAGRSLTPDSRFMLDKVQVNYHLFDSIICLNKSYNQTAFITDIIYILKTTTKS